MSSSEKSDALLALLGDGARHSGAALASALGISRAAVWKRVERLRGSGHDIDARPSLGYRWNSPVEPLSAAAIQRHLRRYKGHEWPEIHVDAAVDSTNRVLRDRAPSGPTMLFAERQSAGRGRMGRVWQSPPGGLYGSLSWSFHDLPRGPVGLSILCGLEAALALRHLGAAGIAVKWPNDLMLGDAKLGGILIELWGEAAGPCRVVIGIGINWSALPEDAVADRRTTGLAQAFRGERPDRNAVAAALVDALVKACRACPDRLSERLAADWSSVDALAGRPVKVLVAGRERQGVAAGVDEDGGFRLRDGADVELFHSGEVSVRALP